MVTRDSVATAGSAIGLVSLLFGWLTLKPNRLAAGTSLNLWETTGWGGTAIIFSLWLICFVLSLRGKERRPAAALSITANLIIIIILILAGLIASQLRQEETSLIRISLGSGIWLSLAGAYMVIFAARQRLPNWPVWRNLASWTGLAGIGVLLITGWLNDLSILQEFAGRQERFVQELGQHIILFSGSVTAGALLGIPLGIWAVRSKRVASPVFFITSITQTMPSLALFGLLIAPLSALSFAFPVLREFGIRGVGATPAIIAIIIYSLLPIVRNTFVSLTQIDPAVTDAGLGMGMSRFQLFRRVQVPLAAPLVLEGVRTASVQAVGNTAVAALIGAGGLGWFIFQGLGQAAADLIILGAIPIITLALVVDTLMRNIVRLSTPKGLAGGNQ
ncbi:MAG: ABC transporter permease [Chloroflexi bacterium]|nr:ABC transporter permease [Chloroflexota bacterium]MBI2980209.1 ABC transporter permease [Chloroflexota bacterium]